MEHTNPILHLRKFHKRIIAVLAVWLFLITPCKSASTWVDALRNKRADVKVSYRINTPFLIKNKNGALSGLEYEMMIGFKYYLKNKYDIDIDYSWHEFQKLDDIIESIESDTSPSNFGLDIISWTPERHRRVKFSAPYFSDIQVIITHRDNPSVISKVEFKKFYKDAKAIIIKGTTFEENLRNINEQEQLNFTFEEVPHGNGIIKVTLDKRLAICYAELTSYLLALEHDLPVKRLAPYTYNGKGFGLVFNKNSDWNIPFDEYLASPEFKLLKEKGITKYMGESYLGFISRLNQGQDEEIMILNQEKKMMDSELSKITHEVKQQFIIRNILIATIIIALITTYFFYSRNRVKTTANEVLMLHKKMIESQNRLLSKRNNELIEVNEEKNNFIGILSHDLRAPINNITGLSKILLMDTAILNDDQIKMIEHISSESRRLNKMVTRILDIERIESKTVEEFRKIDLIKVINRVINNYEFQSTAKSIRINTDMPDELPALGLEQYFFHVFENLISNALKFSPIGSQIFVRASSAPTGVLEVAITDQGPGISDEDKKKMFKKFQVLTAKATGGERSTGLGLSIVNKYINLLDGKLICNSEIGNGTTFITQFAPFRDQS